MIDEQSEVKIIPAVEASVAPKRPRGRPRKVQDATVGIAAKAPVRTVAARPKKTVQPVVEHIQSKGMVTPMQYVFAVGRRKRAIAKVFLYTTGKGEITINGKPVAEYFTIPTELEMLRTPLEHSPFKQSVRIAVNVLGGGIHGQAGAVRHGIARALLKLDETLRPTFRARGFLTRDSREKERKKPGLKKARRGPQWAKR